MPVVRNKRESSNGIYVGRPSAWGNPFVIGKDGSREQVIELYRAWMEQQLALNPRWLDPLQGKDLVCWCAPLACHADLLLERSNS